MTVTADPTLPDVQDVGVERDWILPTTDGADAVRFFGRLLGVGSSFRTHHVGHAIGTFAAPGQRCPACRWFEPRIFRELTEGPHEFDPVVAGQYVVHFAGRTSVPGETTRSRHEYVSGPFEVIELLTTRRINDGREPYLTAPAARVLAQAAGHDRDIRAAYVDRAVS
jgi:hypothetical protein